MTMGSMQEKGNEPSIPFFSSVQTPQGRSRTETGDGQRRTRNRTGILLSGPCCEKAAREKLWETKTNEKAPRQQRTGMSECVEQYPVNVATDIGWMCIISNRLKGFCFNWLKFLPHGQMPDLS